MLNFRYRKEAKTTEILSISDLRHIGIIHFKIRYSKMCLFLVGIYPLFALNIFPA